MLGVTRNLNKAVLRCIVEEEGLPLSQSRVLERAFPPRGTHVPSSDSLPTSLAQGSCVQHAATLCICRCRCRLTACLLVTL